LSLIITRLQVQKQLRNAQSADSDEGEYKSIPDAFSKIYHEEGGLGAFYTGVLQDTGKSMLDSFLFFLFYNFLRQRRIARLGGGKKRLPVLDELSVGMMAGAVSKFFTTPVANIVTRKQTAAMLASRAAKADAASISSKTSPTNIASKEKSNAAVPSARFIASQIYSDKGVTGFWAGYSAALVLTLNPSITFFLYEFLQRAVLPHGQRENPPPQMTFLLAAISKSIASSITYPFSLAKSRSQAAGKAAKSNEKDAKPACKPPRTVFHALAQVARKDGIGALYEGLSGEVLKGFFSNGITMMTKESIHVFVIKLYYLVLKALKKYPSPEEVAKNLGEGVQNAVEVVGEKAREVGDAVSEQVGEAVEAVGDKAKEILEKK
jgi:Mitochondrial carrier protein